MIKRHTIASTVMIITICIVISIFFWVSYQHINDVYQEETKLSITNMRKLFLKDTVNNIIREIAADRENKREDYKRSIELRYQTLSYEPSLSDKEYKDYFIHWFSADYSKDISQNEWTVLLWNNNTEEVLYDPARLHNGDISETLKRVKPLLSYYRVIVHGEVFGLIGVSRNYIDNKVKEEMADKIRKLRFENGSYVWVNEIINYHGGDNYAIRLVHPNLPGTEGMHLSTSMTDIKGNHPYSEELQGVKLYGELFFTYYFKELHSSEVSEKLTYAKLYKDYNWVIDMGIPLDDIRKYIDRTNKKSMETVRSQMISLISLMVIVVGCSLILFLILERLYAKRIRKQMERKR